MDIEDLIAALEFALMRFHESDPHLSNLESALSVGAEISPAAQTLLEEYDAAARALADVWLGLAQADAIVRSDAIDRGVIEGRIH